jgi:hypothetical protein
MIDEKYGGDARLWGIDMALKRLEKHPRRKRTIMDAHARSVKDGVA